MDPKLIIGLTEEERLNYICPVCQSILEEPKLMKCCSSLICDKCIQSSLEKKNRCPDCNRRVTYAILLKPSAITLFSLSKLKINCEYKEKGCNAVLRYHQISEHLKGCPHSRCQYCNKLGYKKSEHNSLLILKKQIESLQIQNQKLKHMLRAPPPPPGL